MNKSMKLAFTAKSAAFAALMTLNLSTAHYADSPATLSVNLNSAVACPDDRSNCTTEFPNANDSVTTNASTARAPYQGKSRYEIESCKAKFQEVKSRCIELAGSID